MPVPVFLYHSVSATPAPGIEGFNVAPDEFARQLDAIAAGRRVLSVAEFAMHLDDPAALPPDAAVITFDDGFADNLDVAAPLLADRGLRATVYVTTGYLGRPGMLSRAGVVELEAAGVEIGAHSHTHPHLDVLDAEAARQEVERSRDVLADLLGHAVPSFAYPHGYSDGRVRRIVEAAGFTSACAVRNAFSHALDSRWAIARLTVRTATPASTIAAWLRGEGAPAAASREALATSAWRGFRRARRLATAGRR